MRRLIGLLVPSTANPMFGELAVHVEAAARDAHGFRVLLGNTHRDQEQESRIVRRPAGAGRARRHPGVVAYRRKRHLEAAIARGLAVVSYDRGGDGDARSRIDHVSPGQHAGVPRMAVEHLAAHGHRRLALVTPDVKTVSRMLKRAGLSAAAQQAGVGDARPGADRGRRHRVWATAISNLADAGYAMAAPHRRDDSGQAPPPASSPSTT